MLAAALAVVAMISASSMAQPPGPPPGRGGPPGEFGGRGFPGRGGPGGGMGGLLRMQEVRDELGLVEDQMTDLQALGEEMRDRFRSEMGNMRERMRDPEFRDEMRARMEEIRGEAEERLAETLTTEQLARLRQINLQQQMQRGGPGALMNPEVSEALGITDTQREQLRERGQKIRSEMEAKMRELRNSAHEQMLEVLTTEQRTKLQEMMGEKFDLPERDRFGRGGPRGRDGEGRRGRGGRFGGPDGPPPPPPGPELD